MNNSNDRYDASTPTDDAALSRLYRETATDSVPPQLDERVLKEARSSARPRFALPMDWMRPLAWTATAGLCLAIGINMTTQPEGSVEWNGDTLQESELAAEGYADDAFRAAPAQPQAAGSVVPGAATHSENRETAAPGLAKDELFGPADQAMAPRAGEFSSADAAAPPIARQRVAPAKAAVRAEYETLTPSSNLPAAAVEESKDFAFLDEAPAMSERVADICGAEGIATADAWYTCIEALEAEGLTEEADSQRRRFLLKYPNYAVD